MQDERSGHFGCLLAWWSLPPPREAGLFVAFELVFWPRLDKDGDSMLRAADHGLG